MVITLLCVQAYTHVHTHTRSYVHALMCTRTHYAYTHIHAYVRTHTHAHAYALVRIRIHAHAHARTCARTHISKTSKQFKKNLQFCFLLCVVLAYTGTPQPNQTLLLIAKKIKKSWFGMLCTQRHINRLNY